MDLSPYTQDRSIRLRFLTKVQFCDHGKSCKACHWLWQDAPNGQGYGRFYVCTLPRKKLHVTPSRFMFTLRYGHTDLFVLHTCDVPLCVNYNHLYAGTQLDNMRDKAERNRYNPNPNMGEKHQNAHFTNEDIRQIFRLRSQGYLQREIAELLGTSRSYIGQILRGKWRRQG